MSEYILLDKKRKISVPSEIRKIKERIKDKEGEVFIRILLDIFENEYPFSFVDDVFESEEEQDIVQLPKAEYFGSNVILNEEEEGGFSVECPELPGCVSQGETEEEAIKNIKEAITAYMECIKKNKIEISELKQMTKIVKV